MSTFDKICPQCEATNSAAAVHCVCGHIFNPLYLEDPHLALEQAAREEQLIEECLVARAGQATEVATEAVQAVLREPESETKLLEATRAQRVARAAKAELVEQRARTAEARLRVHIAEAAQANKPAGTPSNGEGRTSWQAMVVTEALKAQSVHKAAVQLAEGEPVSSRKDPGAVFKAAQAAKVEKAVNASGRNSDLLSLTASANEDAVFLEEAEVSGSIRSR